VATSYRAVNGMIVNLYGGPGTGKSTVAAGVFSLLKQNCELVTEYAKDKVWEEHYKVFDNQLYVFARQYQRVFRLLGKVDCIITDSPLLLSLHYGTGCSALFRELVFETYKSLDNLDIFLTRHKAYNPHGRMQTEEQAKQIDDALLKMLESRQVKYAVYPGTREGIPWIADYVTGRLRCSR
jgi:ABC-type dipeptide/oligopeptide/nickel transport system ATPase subunit